MRKKIILISFAILFTVLLFQPAAAQTLDLYNLDFRIVLDKVLATHELNFAESREGTLIFDLPEDARTISVIVEGKTIKPSIIEDKHFKRLELPLNSSTKQLKITYISNQFLEKTRKSHFLADLSVPYDTRQFQVRIILPTGALLDTPVGATASSVFPKPTAIESDGQRIIIVWEMQNVQKNEGFALLVVYREQRTNQLLYFSLGVVAFSIAALFVLFYTKKLKKEGVSTLHLIETELAVVNALKDAKGNELWQKQLQLKTGFSKAKLSRVLRDLEQRDLVKKIPYGNANKIKLISKK